MHHCTALLGLFLSLPVLAQPTLDPGSATLTPGDQFSYSDGVFLPQGPGGAGITWDLSASALSSNGTSTYVQPSATGMAATFPNATVALDAGSGNYLFYRGTASGFEQDGFATSGYVGTCSDRLVLMQYPMSYGTSFTDNATCTITFGTSWERTTDISVTADGYGTVITANGTITNVLRVHSVQHMIDNQYVPASVYDDDTYAFYKPGVHSPVAIISRTTINFFGFVTSDSTLSVLDGGSIGLDEAVRHDIGVDVRPNPATDRIEVLYGTAAGHHLTIDVLDACGAVVLRGDRASMVSGAQRESLDVSGLRPGAYLVRVTDENGAMGLRRFVRL